MTDLIPESFTPLAALLAGFFLMLPLTPLLIRISHRMGWVASPKADRWHTRSTALMGGIAIYASATLAAILILGESFPFVIWAGASVMFFTGLWDDLWHMSPAAKVILQIIAAGMLLFAGYQFGAGWPLWISVPLTFLWVIGITNALNLLDNMDGLAAGIVTIAASFLAVFAALHGEFGIAAVATALAGAAAGFLVFNFKPARIFMGDSGSLFIGYLLAALAIVVQGTVGPAGMFAVLLVPVAVMAVPIFDTTLVTINRIASGRAVSEGGRDHSSHRLVFLGLSERNAVLTLYAVSAFFGIVALLFHIIELRLFYAVTIYMIVALGVIGAFLSGVDVYRASTNGYTNGDSKMRPHRVLLRAAVMHKRTIALVVADLLLVIACYLLAFTLRYEEGLSAAQEEMIYRTIPFVVIAKMVVFYVSGLYRSWWRHAGTPEMVRTIRASAVASIFAFSIIFLAFSFDPLSRSVFVIDWMLTLVAIAGVRFVFRGLPQYFASRRHLGRPVLLYGAGEAGLLSLREIRANPRLDMVPIGFLDDDREKHGLNIQGLPVLGSMRALLPMCRRYGIEEVLITTTKLTDARKRDFHAQCAEIGIRCRQFRISFDSIKEPVPARELVNS